jgi:hypothetical protein
MSRPPKLIPPIKGTFNGILKAIASGSGAGGRNKKIRNMKRYFVHFKDKPTEVVEGYSYTEKDGRLWFHQKKDKSDFEIFLSSQGVTQITLNEPPLMPKIG